MKEKVKKAFFFVTSRIPLGFGCTASILMYHSVGYNKAFFSVTPKTFERHMRYLVTKKFKVVKLSELVRMMNMGIDIANHVVVTLDDGYMDNFKYAYPILKKYNIPATIFVVTGKIGADMTNSEGVTLPLLSLTQIKEMHLTGLVEFMPHSVSHIPLTKYDDDSWKSDILESKHFLEDNFKARADIFAYPQGKFNKSHTEFIQQNGFVSAVTVKEGLVFPKDPIYELKRNSVHSKTSFFEFRGNLSQAIRIYSNLKRIISHFS